MGLVREAGSEAMVPVRSGVDSGYEGWYLP